MRPVTRPNGDYHNDSLQQPGASGIGKNQPTRCLALCIQEEIVRLNGIIAGLPAAGGEAARAAAIAAVIAGLGTPITTPALVILGIPAAGGFAAQTYNAAIAALPAANQALVDNYIHYRIILRNLNYNIATNTFPFGTVQQLVIGDIPYAVSAMQDARERVRGAGAGAQIYSNAAGAVAIGVPPAAVVRSFTLVNIRDHINTLYNAWSTDANRNISPYTNAASELVNVLGPYCAYCEANLKTQIDVEHMLPKGRGVSNGGIRQGFPSLAKSWFNFLPACPRCNSTKSSRPNKIDITTSAAGLNFRKDDNTNVNIALTAGGGGDRRITDIEYSKIYQNHYQFPLEGTSYQNVGFALWNMGNLASDNTAIANQVNWTIQAVDELNKWVQVNTPGAAQAQGNYRVFIDIGAFGANVVPTPPGQIQKVRNIEEICGLNATNANTDRRVLERTEAWFMALEAVNRIQRDLGAIPNGTGANIYRGVYLIWRDNVIRIIKEKGFLSVWLKIFDAFQHPLAATPANAPIFQLQPGQVNTVAGVVVGMPMNLVQDIANQILISRYFPNTNYNNLP